MERYVDDERVEALAFDYLHFYGNKTLSPHLPAGIEVRCASSATPSRRGQVSRSFLTSWSAIKVALSRAQFTRGATIFHYGWVRSEAQMNLKSAETPKIWQNRPMSEVDYTKIDATILKLFSGTHPAAVQGWLPQSEGIFQVDPNHKLTAREKKHRWMMKLEKMFGLQFSKKHYRLVR